ncbi:MAG TPA: DUF3592 domain-containing protein [Gemmataceae bacterium]|nr:DUF3592 domain-containing protein [Gemmataceae bacterium]
MAADDQAESRVEVHVIATGEPPRGFGQLFPPGTRTELWAGVGLIVASLLGAAWVLHLRFEALALERDPVRVEGTVVRQWVTKENNGRHYRVEYEYATEAGGRVYRDETQLLEGHYNLLREGGPIAVNVCRTDPANHQVIGGRSPTFASETPVRVSLGLLGLLGLGGAVNLWWWWVSRGKARPGAVLVVTALTERRSAEG